MLCAGFRAQRTTFWRARWSYRAGWCRNRRDLPVADRRLLDGRRRHSSIGISPASIAAYARHGSIVVAAVDGEMSCKRLVVEGNVARLAFCNPDLPAFAVEEMGEGAIGA